MGFPVDPHGKWLPRADLSVLRIIAQLRRLRVARGESQREFCERTGMVIPSVSTWERPVARDDGEFDAPMKRPGAHHLARWAHNLGYDIGLVDANDIERPEIVEPVTNAQGDKLWLHVICGATRWSMPVSPASGSAEKRKPTYCTTCKITTHMWIQLFQRVVESNNVM